jgi:hypothetical protein
MDIAALSPRELQDLLDDDRAQGVDLCHVIPSATHRDVVSRCRVMPVTVRRDVVSRCRVMPVAADGQGVSPCRVLPNACRTISA